MNKTIILITAMLIAFSSAGTQAETIELQTASDAEILITAGDSWLHDFPLFLWFKTKNSPQFAIWIEDMNGNYIDTVYVTKKAATEGWMFNGGNRRSEALPFWSHSRGEVYNDGLLLPTKEEPLPDAVTSATPKGSSVLSLKLPRNTEKFIIYAEFNHSTDFNSSFPEDAEAGSAGYSGGKMGSGQPSIIYRALIDSEKLEQGSEVQFAPAGYGSPDGSSGELYTDNSNLTTASDIVASVIFVKK